ncbi:MAG TPA: sensor histidine kinase [Candidatus Eisenbergiella merdavium]|uniref:Sensor histidine kinase n=1 Tax=Candidatus Eisenbergiella merdavium TaxID=2838551 RepID=A0A9D2NF61_9FIRM|nr:sensor histidine kinase [Candidatus Eisenbergiella merdavium]
MKKHAASHLSINTQFKILTGIVLAVFLFLILMIYHNTDRLLTQNANNYSELITRRLENEFSLITDTAETVLMNLQADSALTSLLYAPYSGKSSLLEEAKRTIVNYTLPNPQIYSISLVSDTVHYSSLYSYGMLDKLRDALRGSDSCFLGVVNSDFYHLAESTETDLLTYGTLVYHDGEEAGAIIISMRSAPVLSQFSDETAGEFIGSYYLLCEDDGVLYTFNCEKELADMLWAASQGVSSSRISDSYHLRVIPLAKMDCSLLSALDLNHTGQDMKNITMSIWGSMLLLCIYTLSLFFLLSRNMVRPLNKLFSTIQSIRTVHSRDIPEPVVLGGCRELSAVGQEFTDMMRDISDLNRRIFQTSTTLYEAKIQKQEAEISYLRSQVDPHFLYNTLEVIRRMALERDASEISEITMDISRIFRYSTKGEPLVSLKEELQILEAYIHVQQCRFQKKLEVLYHFPEETLHLKVIKMLLQPLVENAVFHGLETKSGIGTLFVGAAIRDDRLVISIRDDGVGIPPDKLEQIRKELASEVYDTSRHVGIVNTHARIQLQYGREYGLQIESSQDEGTHITLILPAED